MDFETFIRSLFSLLKSSDNLYFVLYALATSLLTQVFKKLIVNKVNVDILHKFDIAVVLPFVFGTIFAVIDLIFVQHATVCFHFFTSLAVSAATIGALATVIFKFVSSLSGQSLSSMLKDDLFGVFYHQLLYFGTVRKQLLEKQLSLKDFISQVKLLATNAVQIYQTDSSAESKKDKLYRLLEGVISSENISVCVDVLNRTLVEVTAESEDGKN